MFNELYSVRGFSLLEILIAIAVFAVGLLAIAALQGLSLRADQQAYGWTVAGLQVANLAESMRANPEGARAGYYANRGDISEPPSCQVCSPFEQATRDLAQWQQATARLLPAGKGLVKAEHETWQVIVFWDEMRTGATGLECSGDAEVDLQCFHLPVER